MTIFVDYTNKTFGSQARSLDQGNLGFNETSGWTIEGLILEDYYLWVSDFKATHPKYGIVEGDFENEVRADSQEALDHFLKYHPYYEWDYHDI